MRVPLARNCTQRMQLSCGQNRDAARHDNVSAAAAAATNSHTLREHVQYVCITVALLRMLMLMCVFVCMYACWMMASCIFAHTARELCAAQQKIRVHCILLEVFASTHILYMCILRVCCVSTQYSDDASMMRCSLSLLLSFSASLALACESVVCTSRVRLPTDTVDACKFISSLYRFHANASRCRQRMQLAFAHHNHRRRPLNANANANAAQQRDSG